MSGRDLKNVRFGVVVTVQASGTRSGTRSGSDNGGGRERARQGNDNLENNETVVLSLSGQALNHAKQISSQPCSFIG
jgi:hypothetical protein